MIKTLVTLAVLFSLAAGSAAKAPVDLNRAVVSSYARLVEATYRDALEGGRTLHETVTRFTASPTAAGLEACRTAWTGARRPYLQTEVFRFYAGPIDDEDGPEGLLNAWPLDESYVDYVKGQASSGIINRPDTFPKITPELLARLNENLGEENISAGYHAIEFLLWGQDFYADSPGRRPHTDYTTAKNAERRKAYLLAACELLVRNLEGLVSDWSGSGDYRRAFTRAPPQDSIRKIMTGMSMLSGFELSGERLLVAYETRGQEDEHSCFSDTTHLDVIYDAQGILNVWEGRYGKVMGKGIRDFAASLDAKLAKRIDAQIRKSLTLSRAIPAPFDQAILGEDKAPGRRAILALVESLEDQTELLVQLAKKAGFDLPTEEHE